MDGIIKTLDEVKECSREEVEILALRRRVDGLKNEIKTLEKDYGDLKGYFRELSLQLNDYKFPPIRRIFTERAKRGRSKCVAVLHLTDWHLGKVQPADEIEGFDEYSPEILEVYIDNLLVDFIKWIEVQRTGYTIQDLYILDTGDNISGDIHKELSVTNAFPAPVQALRCGILKARTIAALSPYFKNIIVNYITPDNHGRLTKKPPAREAGLNTHNYTVGHIAKTMVSDLDNVLFNIYYSHTKSVEVSTRRYLITHGHGVMGWAGFPYYGIERLTASQALIRLNEPDYNRFHKVVMGHWHSPLKHPYYWIGGAACGTDAYDHQKGRRAKPIQCGWLVHPVHGEFNTVDFLLRK